MRRREPRLAPKSVLDRLWYTKILVSFEDILRTLRHATWQERIFSGELDKHNALACTINRRFSKKNSADQMVSALLSGARDQLTAKKCRQGKAK